MTDAPLREVRRPSTGRCARATPSKTPSRAWCRRSGSAWSRRGSRCRPSASSRRMYAVSRDTVREAIRELADTGYLVRRRGRYGGTFVADPLPRPADPACRAARRARRRAGPPPRARGRRGAGGRGPHPRRPRRAPSCGRATRRPSAADEADYRRARHAAAPDDRRGRRHPVARRRSPPRTGRA